MRRDKQIFSVAPMLDWTTTHCRAFHRSLSKNAILYTEMVTIQAIKYSKKDQLIFNHQWEGDVILQVGGSDYQLLQEACIKANNYPYMGINLNLGCPSPKVQKGAFGACLMLEPDSVVALARIMVEHSKHPVSIKLRIGVDQQEGYPELSSLVEKISQTGVTEFIIHARKAWLSGLSPKENREIPPLQYEVVHQLKKDFPHLKITINGGIKTVDQVQQQLLLVDGVMIGREAWYNPQILLDVDQQLFTSDHPVQTMYQGLMRFLLYVEQQLNQNTKLNHLLMPLLGAAHGMANASIWRQELTNLMHDKQLTVKQQLQKLESLITKIFA